MDSVMTSDLSTASPREATDRVRRPFWLRFARGVGRFFLVVALDILLMFARFVLWLRYPALAAGVLMLFGALVEYSAGHSQVAAIAGGAGFVVVVLSRAGRALNDRLIVWQKQLHV